MTRLLIALIVASTSSLAIADATVFANAKVITITNGTLETGEVRVEGGMITGVGASVDHGGATIVDLAGKVLMPGLVDTHSHVGISNRPGGSDSNERQGSVHPELRALDAIHPGDATVHMALAGGITTANVMPGSGNAMGGQTAYIKYRGGTVEDMLIDNNGITGGMKMANGENPKGARPDEPSTRMAVASMQREVFVKAKDYQAAWKHYNETGEGKMPDRDLGMDAMVEILEGKRMVHFHTHRADDIMTAIRLSEEFGFRLVLQHVTEAFKVADEIATRNVFASIIMIDSPGGKHEAIDIASGNNANALAERGAIFAFHTDDSVTDSRWFLRSAALAVRQGLDRDNALRAMTINGAKMLDLDDRIGSIETRKQADLVILSGDPLSVYTKVLMVYIEGEKVFDRVNNPMDERYAVGGFALGDRYPNGEGK